MRTLLPLMRRSALKLPPLLGFALFSFTMLAGTVTGVIHTKAANPLNVAHSAGRRTLAKEIKLLFGNDTEMLFYFTYSKERYLEVRTASIEEHLAPDSGEITRVTVEDERGAVELDQNHDGLWTSPQTAGLSSYDSKSRTLRYADGTSWVFGCVSAPTEPDHGKRYLTAIKQTNGVTFTIQYQPGRDTAIPNSSSRITEVSDQRGVVYTFIYKALSADTAPHLTQIINNIAVSTVTFEYTSDGRLHSLMNSVTGQSIVFEYTASLVNEQTPSLINSDRETSGPTPYELNGNYLEFMLGNRLICTYYDDAESSENLVSCEIIGLPPDTGGLEYNSAAQTDFVNRWATYNKHNRLSTYRSIAKSSCGLCDCVR